MALTRDRTYLAAVALSAFSALLGLGRELYLVATLGLGPRNDALQLCLSITYTISLFNEPVRLAGLNLLGVRVPRLELAGLAAAVVAASVAITASLAHALPPSPWWWVPSAFGAGLANLLVAAQVPYYQRHGPLLRVHAVTTLPNVLILLGLLVFSVAGRIDPAAAVPVLFFAAPIVQLAAFAALRGALDQSPPGGAPARWAGWGEIGAHGLVASGAQLTQIGLRTALSGVPGLLSVFVITLRSVDTVRAILVDTFIATRVRRWAEAAIEPVAGFTMPPVALVVMAAAAGIVAIVVPTRAGVAAILVGGALLTAWTRMQYHRLNTGRSPRSLIRRVAILELSTAALVLLGSSLAVAPVGLIGVAYLARSLAMVVVLRRSDGVSDLMESELG